VRKSNSDSFWTSDSSSSTCKAGNSNSYKCFITKARTFAQRWGSNGKSSLSLWNSSTNSLRQRRRNVRLIQGDKESHARATVTICVISVSRIVDKPGCSDVSFSNGCRLCAIKADICAVRKKGATARIRVAECIAIFPKRVLSIYCSLVVLVLYRWPVAHIYSMSALIGTSRYRPR